MMHYTISVLDAPGVVYMVFEAYSCILASAVGACH